MHKTRLWRTSVALAKSIGGHEPSPEGSARTDRHSAAQAKQRILERIETVESADGAGNGQVAWRTVLVRRRDAWAALSSNTIFNAGSFVTLALACLALPRCIMRTRHDQHLDQSDA